MLEQIIMANFVVSLGSIIGAIPLLIRSKKLENFLIFFVSLSAGTLMGGALIHLIPEASEVIDLETTMKLVLVSFTGFLLLEKILHWHHDHDPRKQGKTKQVIGYMNLIGDLIHNFIDGLVIAASFKMNYGLGVASTIAIFMHEVPQELGDMGVLLHAGFSKFKAVYLNFLTALSAVLGGISGYYLISGQNLTTYLLAIAGGGFIYIAASDLVPEIKKENKLVNSMVALLIFTLGFLVMIWLKD